MPTNPRWFIAALLTFLGCSGGFGKNAEMAAANALISDQDEAKLGAQVKQELDQKEKIKYVQDPVITNYVRSVSDKVIAFAKKDRPAISWQVFVIDDPATVNAFATPGGYLYVYTGLIRAAGNEAELAGVMAHEAGHVVARHSARAMVDAYGLEAISQMILGKNASQLGEAAANIAAQGTLLAHSRAAENEADEYGATYASAAGYDPHGIVTFFQKLAAGEGSSPSVLKWLSDHPATPDRIAHMNRFIEEHQLTGSTLGADKVAAIKARIPAPPPAKAKESTTSANP